MKTYNTLIKKYLWGPVFFQVLTSMAYIAHASPELQSKREINICYLSLGNDKEYFTTNDFIKNVNISNGYSINVHEWLTFDSNPEHSLKKMIDSGITCHGLVISGHHTGSFGGTRAKGSLSIDFLERLNCNEKYYSWFMKVKALWLQGRRTLGGKITGERTADFEAQRVTNVRKEDSLEQDQYRMSMDYYYFYKKVTNTENESVKNIILTSTHEKLKEEEEELSQMHDEFDLEEVLQRNEDLNIFKTSLVSSLLSSEVVTSKSEIDHLISNPNFNDESIKALGQGILRSEAIDNKNYTELIDRFLNHPQSNFHTTQVILEIIGKAKTHIDGAEKIIKDIYNTRNERYQSKIDIKNYKKTEKTLKQKTQTEF